jgi:hypothetical protein
MRNLFVLISSFLLLFSLNTFAQGIIRGKITDENGEAIIGATVLLKTSPPTGGFTDLDGNYSITVKDSLPVNLQVSFVGYITIDELISMNQNKVLTRNFTLKSKENTITQVEIISEAIKSKDYYLENLKKKSSVSIDYISSETMKKTGDNNVTSAIGRVSGVSTNGSFITVRGIGDRYIKTNINGLRIPTLDPFTNNIKLDIIPASLVDNIIISKTTSPELAGDWAGAYISVETKDYPDKLSVVFESTVGYNSQTTGQTMLGSQNSSTDWLGFDNGFRDINHNAYIPVNTIPSTYQEMAALGLTSYFNSLGVTANSAWNETFFRLGLVELGLLAKAKINDTYAFSQARDIYNSNDYKGRAFGIINQQASQSGKRMPNNWDLTPKKGPVDFSQSLSLGNQVKLFGKPLGFIFSYRYSRSFLNDPASIAQRAALDANGLVSIPFDWQQNVSRETNGWSGLINLAYKPSPNHSISLLFMPNFIGVNNLRSDSLLDESASYIRIFSKNQFYEERKQYIYQLKTEHYFPSIASKLNFDASYTKGESSVPDFKGYSYFFSNDSLLILDRTYSNTSRFYRYLFEDLFDSKISLEIPFFEKPGYKRKIKLGGAYQYNFKDNRQYNYLLSFSTPASYTITNSDVAPFFSHDNFDLNQNNQVTAFYQRDENPGNRNIGRSSIYAAYLMTDYNITKSFRVAGGIRAEYAKIYTDVYLYDSLGYEPGDGRRFYPGGIVALAPNPGDLKGLNILPSLSLIYQLNSNETSPANIRANYGKSLARPSMRELSEIIVFDYELRAPVFGNSDLKMVTINNYDFRFEKYFKKGDNISASLFYKNFKNHIELVNSNIGFSWQNIENSFATGIEIEGKKSLFKNFEFRSNITLTKSLSEFVVNRLELNNGLKTYIPFDTVSRAMFGQSPYVVNGMLTYKSNNLGITATITYNRQGPRLAIASVDGTPDIYELPRNLMDFKISKTIGSHFAISLRIRDLLNSPIRRSYKFEEGWTVDYDKFRFGTFYQVGISYTI